MNLDAVRQLPALGVGLLLNPDTLHEPQPDAQFLEIIPDRFWLDRGPGLNPRYEKLRPSVAALDQVADGRTILCHSTGLSIGSASIFDREHVGQIRDWQNRYRFPWHSDHLAFSRLMDHDGEVSAALTLPMTRDEESLDLLSERIQIVQQILPIPFLLENNVYFVIPPDEPFTEAEFLNELCRRSGCGLLLDLHNVLVNAVNHNFTPESMIDALDLTNVVEIHIAGGDELAGFYTDSHAGPVAAAVWPLLERALRAAPWIRAVTFEYHESYRSILGPGGVARELAKARSIWEDCH